MTKAASFADGEPGHMGAISQRQQGLRNDLDKWNRHCSDWPDQPPPWVSQMSVSPYYVTPSGGWAVGYQMLDPSTIYSSSWTGPSWSVDWGRVAGYAGLAVVAAVLVPFAAVSG